MNALNLSKQEIFDRVAIHLMTQGHPAVNEDGDCRYRGERGTSCAVGCLIPDELYDPEIEGESIHVLPSELKIYLGRDHLIFLSDLQKAHDNSSRADNFMPWFRESMSEIADEYKLDPGVLNA